MTKPVLLDAFCGAGGATKGYQRAGFYVVGVDLAPQPNYCGDEFIQADALDVLRSDASRFDAIHASPPCQHYANVTRWRGRPSHHPDLIGPTRQGLMAAGVPWVIENVRTRELNADLMLCGSMFELPVRRHRYFQFWHPPALLLPSCRHRTGDYAFDHGGKQPESVYRDAMDCAWMTVRESREAVPPAYTEWIGKQLLSALA